MGIESTTLTTSNPTFDVTWAEHTQPLALTRLHREIAGHAALFDRAMARVVNLSKRLGGVSQFYPEELWPKFAEKNPALALWVLHRGHDVEGHLLADIRMWNGEYVGWVIQEEVDDPKALLRGHLDDVMEQLNHWVRSFPQLNNGRGVSSIIMTTFNEHRAWTTRYGFTKFMTMYQRKVSP